MARESEAVVKAMAYASSLDSALVAVVGPPCRTWYADLGHLVDVLIALADVSPRSAVAVGSRPFSTQASRMAMEVGLEVIETHDASAVSNAELIIAFPREDAPRFTTWGREIRTGARTKYDYTTASPALVTHRRRDQPVLSVYRYFPHTYEDAWTPES